MQLAQVSALSMMQEDDRQLREALRSGVAWHNAELRPEGRALVEKAFLVGAISGAWSQGEDLSARVRAGLGSGMPGVCGVSWKHASLAVIDALCLLCVL
jgi:hypothetical protein